MSDEFGDSDQSESGEDFSASEDEWKPDKGDNVASDDDEDDEVDTEGQTELEDSIVTGKDKKTKTSKPKATKRKSVSSLRSKLYRKYKPPPKTLNSSVSFVKKPLPPKIANILSNSRFEKTKMLPSTSQAPAATYESESESSEDGGLVAPDELDFDSIAANAASTSAANSSKEIVPKFDCNAGMRLSDSSDDNDDDDDDVGANNTEHSIDTNAVEKKSIIDRINDKSSAGVRDFSDFQTFNRNLDAAKAHMKKLATKQTTSTDETDITKLLSLGEGASNNVATTTGIQNKSKRKRKKHERDSDDSDWENVADHVAGGHKHRPNRDIQITVGSEMTRGMSREKKKALDMEALLKRRMNRDIREKQVYLHKVSLLGWIAHGNYVNRIINSSELMKMCLKHLPSNNSYPSGDTELKYFLSFTKWFHGFFELKSKKMYCELRTLPPKHQSLSLQIHEKHAISKHDYVLIYATMLRAIGIQCRVVINMPVAPLRPPQSELFVVSSKPKVDENVAEEKKKSIASAKSDSASTKKLKSEPKSTNAVLKKSKEAEPNTLAKKLRGKVESKKVEMAKRPMNDIEAPTLVKKLKISAKRMTDSFIQRHTGETANTSSKPAIDVANSNGMSKSKQTSENGSPAKKSPTTATKASAVSHKSTESPMFSNKIKNTQKQVQPESAKSAAPSKRLVAAAPAYSPRKTRSRAQRDGNVASTSTAANGTQNSTTVEKSVRPRSRLCLKLPQMDGASDKLPSKKKKTTETANKTDNSDSDFAPSPPKRVRPKMTSTHFAQTKPKSKALETVKRIDLRVLSTDDDDEDETRTVRATKITAMDTWVEAYNEKDKKWIVIDPVKNKVDAVDHIRKVASKPIVYAFAWNNDNTIRDVTPRYCNNFHTSTRKQRADPLWLQMALRRYAERKNTRTIIEDVEFSRLQMDTPLPKSVTEFKNHPLYALERHLLKFEGIYPPNAMTLGYIRNEPVYARECVHMLHSREIWVKQARTVKVGEIPYKIVKARPKWNRALNEMEEAKPLDIFGFWQTQPYEPPVAENGIVPRNAYGNVELFKPEMLPIGTRHIQLPGLNRVCKKLNIDCAQAVVGFDFHSGSSHPTFDGFVVCEEFADQVVAQWYADQDEIEEKEQKKYEARVYGNWKKLIKGLLIRQRLKRKYDFGKK